MTTQSASTTNFRKLWLALSISLMGSEVTVLALPLVAVLTLDASPLEMGVLASAGQMPFLLCSLMAGVLIDRVRRRPVLVTTDICAGLLLLTVPLAMPFGGPGFLHLCVVAFGVGTFAVTSEVAHYAYVPTLVGREELTDCNSRLQISHSAANAAGPGVGGALVQAVTAPIALVLDALSFLFSAFVLSSIRHAETPPPEAGAQISIRKSLADGLRHLFKHRLLRSIIFTGATSVFFESGLMAIYVLYATKELGLSPALIGLVFVAGGLGAVPGALLARWAGGRFGVGPSIIGGWFFAASMGLFVPLVHGPVVLVVTLLATAKALGALTDAVANIHQWSLRQAVTPNRLAGRVTAGQRFVVYGAGAIGALAGGALGSAMGLRGSLTVCAAGCLLAPLWALCSPLRHLREQPPPIEEADEETAQARPVPPGEEGSAEPDRIR